MSGEWIEWKGGDRPHPGNTQVEVIYRTGRKMAGVSAFARWWHDDHSPNGDIVAYRIIEPHEPASSSQAANS